MTTTNVSTRRSFIWTAGAALSAPLAAAAANAPASAPEDGDALKTRLEMLEDANAIRALSQAYARHVTAGSQEEAAALFADPSDAPIGLAICGLTPYDFGERDAIEIAPDRTAATAILHCIVETESVIEPSCPLVEMAREQGGGVVRGTEHGVFENAYIRREGIWKIHRSNYRRAS